MSNYLLDQYGDTYTDLSKLKGKFNYACNSKRATCGDTIELERKACPECPYVAGRRAVRKGQPVLANPASYLYASLGEGFKVPDLILIDEADRLWDFCRTLGETELRLPVGTTLDTSNMVAAVDVIDRQAEALFRQAEAENRPKEKVKLARQMEKLRKASLFLKLDPESFYIQVVQRLTPRGIIPIMKVGSVQPSRAILNAFLSAKKVVLVSATLFEKDVQRMAGKRSYRMYKGDPAIPPERRPIYLDPVDIKVNWQTSPALVAEWIKKWRDKYPDRNTIVHVSYEWAFKLRPFFASSAHINTRDDDKATVIRKFKREGGLFIAAGCAEGVDFPYDEARLNLIPLMYRSNLGDEGVKRRLAAPGGREDYDLDSIRTTIQQAGRSTRAPDDESIIVVGDPQFVWMMGKYKNQLPKGFYESIQFGRKI